MNIYITGHKSPDLDSIVSALAYAEFLKKNKTYADAKLIPVRAGEANKETQHIFKKFEAELPESLDTFEIEPIDAFILVDHNEDAQRHEKVVSEQIIEIVDHHKLNVTFAAPLRVDVKPVGSTSTLIAELFDMYDLKPSDKIAKLMLSAILSDTQGLKSSTTTGLDAHYAQEMKTDLEMDLEKLTFELFKAKSDITGLAPEEIVTKDYKIFDFGEKKVFINQVETVEPEKILAQKDALIEALEETKAKLGAGQAYNVITDILEVNSQILYTTEEEEKVLEEAFTAEGESGVINVGPKMSRKKDIAPAIEEVVS